MGNHRVDLDLAIHVPVADFRQVGPASRAAERGALPDPAGNQLERPRSNLLAGFRHANHDRYAPAAVAGLERLAHHGRVAGAVEGVVRAAVGQGDQMLDDIAIDLLGVDEMRHAEAATPFFLAVVEVDADDLVGAEHPGALDDIEPDAAKPKHDHVGARRDLGGVHHGAYAGRHAAADVATLIEGRVFANF